MSERSPLLTKMKMGTRKFRAPKCTDDTVQMPISGCPHLRNPFQSSGRHIPQLSWSRLGKMSGLRRSAVNGARWADNATRPTSLEKGEQVSPLVRNSLRKMSRFRHLNRPSAKRKVVLSSYRASQELATGQNHFSLFEQAVQVTKTTRLRNLPSHATAQVAKRRSSGRAVDTQVAKDAHLEAQSTRKCESHSSMKAPPRKQEPPFSYAKTAPPPASCASRGNGLREHELAFRRLDGAAATRRGGDRSKVYATSRA